MDATIGLGTGPVGAPDLHNLIWSAAVAVDVVSPPLNCRVLPDRERVVVALDGELDMASTATAWKALDELLPAGFAKVTVDLRGVTFIDSAGLHLLMAASRLAREHDCAFALVAGPASVRRAFALAALETAFTFEADGPRL